MACFDDFFNPCIVIRGKCTIFQLLTLIVKKLKFVKTSILGHPQLMNSLSKKEETKQIVVFVPVGDIF